MSEIEDPNAGTASHTLAYLRRIDRRQQDITELFVRQQELIGRIERDMREGFENVRNDMRMLHRDVRELKSDMVLMENRIVTAAASDHHIDARLDEHDDRLASLEVNRQTL